MEQPAVWAEADVASLAAALMVQRPPARPREDALLQAERLYYRLRIEYLEEDLLTEAARNGILSGMLERCYDRSEQDLARLRMALERAAQLEGEASRRWSAASRPSRKRTEIFAGERTVGGRSLPCYCSDGPAASQQDLDARGLARKLEDTEHTVVIAEEAGQIFTALRTPATRAQRAELALRWFEAGITWRARWGDDDEGSPRSPQPDAEELISEWQAELSAVET